MIGLDTNVLVRYLVKDDLDQARAAHAVIDRDCTEASPGWVSVIVACELVWVLGRGYRLPRARIAEVMQLLLDSDRLRFESHEAVRAAVVAYRDSQVDLADYLIGRGNQDAGCDTTVTFDTTAATLPFFSPLTVAE